MSRLANEAIEAAHPLGNGLNSFEIWKKTLFNHSHVPNYTFEERYVRGITRPSYPERDELDRLHLLRVEGFPGRHNSNVGCAFLESVLANPLKIAHIWCDENGAELTRTTYRQLYDEVRTISAQLLTNYKLVQGDRVLLVYEPCVEFFSAFWACILTGIIPVPVCPPDPFNLEGDHADKLTSVYLDCSPKAILTSSKYKDSVAAARLLYPDQYTRVKSQIMNFTQYLWVPTDTLPYIPAEEFEICLPPFELTGLNQSQRVTSGTKWTPMFTPQSTQLYKSPVQESDIAFLQYTSGSTGMAKGVIVHHRMLCSNSVNCALLTGGVGNVFTYQWALGVSWLPTFHDMGLIGFHVTPIVIGGTMVYQSPIHFIQNPVSWLQIISRYNQVFTGAPPFALDLLVKRTSPQELAELNLSGLDSLVLGAEPIRSSYMEAFAKKFKSVGFTPEHFITCFGMAENVLHVTGKWGNTYGVTKILVDSQSLRKNKIKVYKQELIQHQSSIKIDVNTNEDSQWLVSSGELIPFYSKQTLALELDNPLLPRLPHLTRREFASHIIIVDPNTFTEVKDGEIGEVWVLSPSKTAGYWNRPELSQEQFHAVLNKAVKSDTIDLLQWVTQVVPTMHAAGDLKGNVDPSLIGKSLSKTLTTETPQTNVLITSLSATTINPGTNTLKIDPKIKNIQAEWLRTGDTGVLVDGHIYITGRIKDMIILRGQNFYADDIEHTVSTDTDDFASGTIDQNCDKLSPTSTKIRSGRPPALDFIRPGHCIAYSIELSPNGQLDAKSDPVLKAGVEGEHLCLLVELSNEVINAFSEENFSVVNDDQKTTTDHLSSAKELRTPLESNQKTGNQIPLWQSVLNTYSKQIIGGMASMNRGDLDSVHREEDRVNQTCCDAVSLYSRAILFNGIRMGLNTAQTIMQLVSGPHVSTSSSAPSQFAQPRSSTALSSNNSQQLHATLSKLPSQQISEDLDDSKLFLPADRETVKLQKLYPQSQLNTIAAAIRRVISSKFLLIVDKIIFLAPRTIKKTSSGKKRRNDTVFAVENHYYNHRVIGFSYSKSMQSYQTLVEKQGLTNARKAVTNQSKSTVSAATTTNTTTLSTISQTPLISQIAIVDNEQKHAGTIGVSLHSSNTKYDTPTPQSEQPSIVQSSSATINTTKQSMLQDDGFVAKLLLPNTTVYSKVSSSQLDQHSLVKRAKMNADKITFETIQPRVLALICQEINNNLKAAQNKSSQDVDDEMISFASSSSGNTTGVITFEDGATELTVEYLQKVSTYDSTKQQELLDEFGLDSLTGFKLAKSFAIEFDLPQAGLGPHIFLNDPSLDGVSRVIMRMIQSHAEKLTTDYELNFNTKYRSKSPTTAPSTSSKPSTNTPSLLPNTIKPLSTSFNETNNDPEAESDYDTHDKTSAYVFRGTTDPKRIPYILGIGTAVPAIGAPQEHVIEAMLGPMQLDPKSAERFRRIGQHSGVNTRYSVLDNLGQIFWGKEGINQDVDEFVDARQQVYKREAVKLSIQSSADAVCDWLGEKIYLNDEQRDAQRDEVYKHCESQHRLYEEKLQQKNEKDGIANTPAQTVPQHLNPALKSFAEGDQHVVQTTSGNADEDKIIAQLGNRILTTFNRTITHIVAITCTGIIVPGLEFHIMQALQLPLTTQRLPITFAGCFGAISGLRTASALAVENPAHRVLVVCTELCTLHMQLNDKIDNLIASALFADGSGAFVVGCAPTPTETPIFSIDTLSSFIIPNTVQQMAWESTKSGMVIGLAKEIASEIFNVIGDVVDDMLKYTPDPENPQHRIHPSQCNMAIHPGGPLIINTIQSVFGLDHIDNSTISTLSYTHPVAETWKTLNEYGNMSSATLVFVLDRIREQPGKFDKPTPALAFGPGLNIECALLHRLKPKDPQHPKYKNANHK